jgi:hypothetical protein
VSEKQRVEESRREEGPLFPSLLSSFSSFCEPRIQTMSTKTLIDTSAQAGQAIIFIVVFCFSTKLGCLLFITGSCCCFVPVLNEKDYTTGKQHKQVKKRVRGRANKKQQKIQGLVQRRFESVFVSGMLPNANKNKKRLLSSKGYRT